MPLLSVKEADVLMRVLMIIRLFTIVHLNASTVLSLSGCWSGWNGLCLTCRDGCHQWSSGDHSNGPYREVVT